MSRLGEIKAKRALRAFRRLGFEEKRREGSHRLLVHIDGRKMLFSFHENETIGPVLLKKMLKDIKVADDTFREKI